MATRRSRQIVGHAAALVVASVWLIHGAYNKLMDGSPRQLAIVQSVPGFDGRAGERLLTAVGLFEVVVSVWVLTTWLPSVCAAVQTLALLSMNTVELIFARDLLLWPAGLIRLNIAFVGLAWMAAWREPWRLRTRLRRHPIPIEAHFRDCLALTYAVPEDVLRPLVPPGLELETLDGYGFVAIALVQTESLRPAGLPAVVGQDFFLAGYRIFTRFRAPDGRALRGLRILRSDANRALMVTGGNLLTHYNYHRCNARIERTHGHMRVRVETIDRGGDLDLTMDRSLAPLPPRSPFGSWREARPFAGPLLYTFDYEPETHAIVAIRGMRTHWQPAPVSVDVRHVSFFDQPLFAGCAPILAAAFYVHDIDYRWERGVRYALAAGAGRSGEAGGSGGSVKDEGITARVS